MFGLTRRDHRPHRGRRELRYRAPRLPRAGPGLESGHVRPLPLSVSDL